MSWVLFALFSAACKAAGQIFTKHVLKSFTVLEVSLFIQIVAAVIMLPLFNISGLIKIPENRDFHIAAWATIILNVIAIFLIVEAIRVSDLSYSLPFLALTPVFSVCSAWLIRGEQTTFTGFFGLVFVLIGALAVGAISFSDFIRFGGRRVLTNRGVIMVIIVAGLYAVSTVYDKIGTLLSDPLTFTWYSNVCRGAIFFLLFLLFLKTSLIRKKDIKGNIGMMMFLFLISCMLIFEAIFQMVALKTGAVPYVLGIKRTSILITSIIGFAEFKATFSIFRLFGAGVMVVGAAMIYFA